MHSPDPKNPVPLILVVDDDPDHLELVQRWIQAAGFRSDGAGHGRQALAKIELQRPDLVVSDLYMDEMDGLKLVAEIHQHDPVLPIILVSGQAGVPEAMEAAQLGVETFLEKPLERKALISAISTTLKDYGNSGAVGESAFAPQIIHRSTLMRELLSRAERIATQESTVLIQGPTGSGKELLASAIHQGSPRAEAPYVSINCSALPEQLLESELFGHEKGAFTGATQRHEGLFKAANGGTLFLDEVGDMPLTVQAKLLRVLQDFQVRPVGATQSSPVDVRIIAATNNDLQSKIEEGEFREDLFYRLNVIPLRLPALGERRDDIQPLVDHFLKKLAPSNRNKQKRFAPDALKYMLSYTWPGNVRQLQNTVEQCHALSTTDVIPLNLVVEAINRMPNKPPTLDEARMAFERRYLASLLRTTSGNVTDASALAGRNRTEFYKLLHRHSLEPAAFRKKASR